MLAVSELCATVAQHSGVPMGRVRMVARRLAEAGLLPSGIGRRRPMAGVQGAATLLIGVMTDAPLHSVAAVTRRYSELRGTDDKSVTLHRALVRMLGSFLKVDPENLTLMQRVAWHSIIEICNTSSEARIAMSTTDGDPIEVEFMSDGGGKFEPHADTQLRKSVALPGAVILRIAWSLRGEN